MPNVTRRAFLAGAVAAARAAGARATPAQASPTRLILLGTGGGPRPRTASSASAQVIVSNGVAYVVDCGDGVARQLVFAGVPLARGADVLVHAAYLDGAAVDRLAARVTNAATLKASIPADDPQITDRMWIAAAQSTFRGTVILGKDLLEI